MAIYFQKESNKLLNMRGESNYKKALILHEMMYVGKFSEKQKFAIYRDYFITLKKAAYSGHKEAQYDYAQQFEDMNFSSLKNPNYNPKKCVFWYTKSCNQGFAPACNNLAHLIENGIGVRKNLKAAFKLYKKSADLGYEIAKENYKIMLKQLRKNQVKT